MSREESLIKRTAPCSELSPSTSFGLTPAQEPLAIHFTGAMSPLSRFRSTTGLSSQIFRGATFGAVPFTSALLFRRPAIQLAVVGGSIRLGLTTPHIRGFQIIPRWVSGRTGLT